jgi:hypothetical protein
MVIGKERLQSDTFEATVATHTLDISADLLSSVVKSTDVDVFPELGLTETQLAGMEIFHSVCSDSILTCFDDGCASNDNELVGTYKYLLFNEGALVPSYTLSVQLPRTQSIDM